jgi:isoquinoline 1-oxidoreductase alpha subunit
MMSEISLKVNGEVRILDVDPSTPLLWVLRDHLGMTGTKFGCGIAQCGACTVHLNGEAARSCSVPAEAASGADVITIEGLAANGGAILQKLWVEMNVAQCGYCQAGVLMATAAMLKQTAKPSDDEIDALVSNICRCGTYPRRERRHERDQGRQAILPRQFGAVRRRAGARHFARERNGRGYSAPPAVGDRGHGWDRAPSLDIDRAGRYRDDPRSNARGR